MARVAFEHTCMKARNRDVGNSDVRFNASADEKLSCLRHVNNMYYFADGSRQTLKHDVIRGRKSDLLLGQVVFNNF